ncbi:MAG: MarR family transcriptional regulator [Actinomycetota bacterium]
MARRPAPSTDALRPTGALLATQIAVAEAIEQRAVAATDLDPTTCDLLLRLGRSPSGELRGAELCRQLRLSPGYVSRRIDRAEAAGLVARRADPDDRRAQLISMTDAGREALADFEPRLVQVVDEVVHSHLTDDEVATLIELLDRIELAATTLVNDHDAVAAGV